MKIALGSDERGELPVALERALRDGGHEVLLFGALAPGGDEAWPSVGRAVGMAVANGDAATGIVCCWTGTGVSIAANKVPGVRAALCGDAETASGARMWNDANVLALSLRATTPSVGAEILAAWLTGKPTSDERYRAMIEDVE
jgi:ribose 5-phosphate isomerase B